VVNGWETLQDKGLSGAPYPSRAVNSVQLLYR
jgi:hypothetical protein